MERPVSRRPVRATGTGSGNSVRDSKHIPLTRNGAMAPPATDNSTGRVSTPANNNVTVAAGSAFWLNPGAPSPVEHLRSLLFAEKTTSSNTRAFDMRNTTLFHAASLGRVDVVRFLLRNGVALHWINDGQHRRSFLHAAAAKGQVDVAKVLLLAEKGRIKLLRPAEDDDCGMDDAPDYEETIFRASRTTKSFGPIIRDNSDIIATSGTPSFGSGRVGLRRQMSTWTLSPARDPASTTTSAAEPVARPAYNSGIVGARRRIFVNSDESTVLFRNNVSVVQVHNGTSNRDSMISMASSSDSSASAAGDLTAVGQTSEDQHSIVSHPSSDTDGTFHQISRAESMNFSDILEGDLANGGSSSGTQPQGAASLMMTGSSSPVDAPSQPSNTISISPLNITIPPWDATTSPPPTLPSNPTITPASSATPRLVDLQDTLGQTPLHIAIQSLASFKPASNKESETVDVPIPLDSKAVLLPPGPRKPDFSRFIDVLLDETPATHIHIPTLNGDLPLHLACRLQLPHIVSKLLSKDLEQSAFPNERTWTKPNNLGLSAIHEALVPNLPGGIPYLADSTCVHENDQQLPDRPLSVSLLRALLRNQLIAREIVNLKTTPMISVFATNPEIRWHDSLSPLSILLLRAQKTGWDENTVACISLLFDKGAEIDMEIDGSYLRNWVKGEEDQGEKEEVFGMAELKARVGMLLLQRATDGFGMGGLNDEELN